jgi:hypothetical protein
MAELQPFERALLDQLLDGNLPQLQVLRGQLAASTVSSREFSGTGVFTHFAVPAQCSRVTPPDFELSDVTFELLDTENGGGVVLFVSSGAIEMLEVYLHTDAWPEPAILKSVAYLHPRQPLPANPVTFDVVPIRDLDYVNAEIAREVHERGSA